MPSDDIPELTATEQARWAALRAAIHHTAQSLTTSADREEVQAALNQVTGIDFDQGRVRVALHVPDDAGDHAVALERILRRVPRGWGRWISCHAGWYRTDALLADIDPGHQVHQIKEKWACLAYYAHTAMGADVQGALDEVTTAVREQSREVCEMCGALGAEVESGGWLKTMCRACAVSSAGLRDGAHPVCQTSLRLGALRRGQGDQLRGDRLALIPIKSRTRRGAGTTRLLGGTNHKLTFQPQRVVG